MSGGAATANIVAGKAPTTEMVNPDDHQVIAFTKSAVEARKDNGQDYLKVVAGLKWSAADTTHYLFVIDGNVSCWDITLVHETGGIWTTKWSHSQPKDDEIKRVLRGDIRARAIAEFAVMKHNQEAHTKLVFDFVVDGLWWAISDTSYYLLLIQTRDDKGAYWDITLASEKSSGEMTLEWYESS